MAWVVLLASAAAVALAGIAATIAVFSGIGGVPRPPSHFWGTFVAASALTTASLSLRSLRWVFLLRRAETRIPIRDAYIGYFTGFSLLFVPLLLGEIAVRAIVHRRRGGVPVTTTALGNVWERVLDLLALGLIASVALYARGDRSWWLWLAPAATAILSVSMVRRFAIALARAGVLRAASSITATAMPRRDRLATWKGWWVALAASVGAWILPGIGLWLLARAGGVQLPFGAAQHIYASSSVLGGISLIPGGVVVTGSHMLEAIEGAGMPPAEASLTVLAARLATVGVTLLLGLVFLTVHLRGGASQAAHFDEIAAAYDVQIPESRRLALLERKTMLMRDIITRRGAGAGAAGLDVGCGQGAYVAEMRRLGFDVRGIDASAGQVAFAGRNVGDPSLVRVGSALDIPAADASYDFLYVINVLHHLSSVQDQRRAFRELFRVLKPGGLLFVHEINTRNVLFRFYMGYIFPSLNCIDEGVERWLLPHRLEQYTDAAVVDIRYFTFLPDFIPQATAQALAPLERWLESSRLASYAAHYMAVLVKPQTPTAGVRAPDLGAGRRRFPSPSAPAAPRQPDCGCFQHRSTSSVGMGKHRRGSRCCCRRGSSRWRSSSVERRERRWRCAGRLRRASSRRFICCGCGRFRTRPGSPIAFRCCWCSPVRRAGLCRRSSRRCSWGEPRPGVASPARHWARAAAPSLGSASWCMQCRGFPPCAPTASSATSRTI
jgi:ubiquinone/menaquinone biosynthesis C-methylase UbiE/uncharacterized membrane protein YbhN (UPF0104 family)